MAIAALARKILSIIHYLLITKECYLEEGFDKKQVKLPSSESMELEIRRAIQILGKAGYIVSGGWIYYGVEYFLYSSK
ncbi:MAG: hypothetical protein SVM80_04785 [Halobacteriota archaeon]|nr:hypothetical protein [Halobacteriota archaeon]